MLGDTDAEAAELAREVRRAQVSPQTALMFIEQLWNTELSGFDVDGPLPAFDPVVSNNLISKGRASVRQFARDPVALAAEWRARAEAGNLSAREVVIEVTGRQSFIGSAETVAATINELVQADAADGYILVPHITPGGLAPFVDQVVPLLQERGVFRADYTGTTLRDHLGLAPLDVPVRRPAEEERMTSTPLTVLDLVPISSGSNATQALRNSIDLAQQTERLGYARYWFAEHHLNPGVAGTSPAVVLALTAAATSTIRLGSGAVQMGHRTALATVEEFGLLDALHPGRFDLGLGRSGGQPREAKAPALVGGGAAATVVDGRTPNGLFIPPRFDIRPLLGSPRFALQRRLLQLPHAEPQNYTEQVGDVWP